MPSTANAPASFRRRKEELLFQASALALAVVAGFGCWFAAAAFARRDDLRGLPPDRPRQLADFSLTDRTGRTVTRAELDGKVLAVSFLFTSCATTCPEVSQRMSEIQRLTTNEPDVQLVSFTVDPRSDTPPVLAKWGAQYGADTNRWLLLTGRKPELQELIGASFLATNDGDVFNFMPCNFTGLERIAVVDKHGRVRIYFNGMRAGTPAVVAAEIERLRRKDDPNPKPDD
jgi:cytochrome oxidase Cu insertion factor (SCO1/SenC/PrrC family)